MMNVKLLFLIYTKKFLNNNRQLYLGNKSSAKLENYKLHNYDICDSATIANLVNSGMKKGMFTDSHTGEKYNIATNYVYFLINICDDFHIEIRLRPEDEELVLRAGEINFETRCELSLRILKQMVK